MTNDVRVTPPQANLFPCEMPSSDMLFESRAPIRFYVQMFGVPTLGYCRLHMRKSHQIEETQFSLGPQQTASKVSS